MLVPSWVRKRTNKWNRVIDFVANPCDAPLSVYFETLRPAAGRAVVTLLSFGMDDVARGMLRPKGVYGNKHGGRKKRKRGSVGIPELGEEIGKRLPGADTIKSREFGALEKKLWLLDGIGQRILFWLMVADIITDFVYDWTTGIYKEEYCNKAGTVQALAQLTTWHGTNADPNLWEPGNFGSYAFDHNVTRTGWGQYQTTQPQLLYVTAAFELKNNDLQEAQVTLMINTGPTGGKQQVTINVEGLGTASASLHASGLIQHIIVGPDAGPPAGAITVTLSALSISGREPVSA
jgi:hypothetical protein